MGHVNEVVTSLPDMMKLRHEMTMVNVSFWTLSIEPNSVNVASKCYRGVG